MTTLDPMRRAMVITRLAILPGLIRYDEAIRGPVRHAFRVTVRRTNGYVWPASHRAGDELDPAVRSLTAGDFEVVRLGWC